MRFQPELEDIGDAWSKRETHEARMEFLQTLPDDALNSLVESNFWPFQAERVELMSVVYEHPGLTMLSAMNNYAGSPATHIGVCELQGTAHREPPEVVEFLLAVRDKLNNFAFVDAIDRYQHFCGPLKILLRDNAEKKYGRFALSPAVVQYGRDAIEERKQASEKARYNVDGEVLDAKEMVQAMLGAIEDPVASEQSTKIGRAGRWLRHQLLGR